MKTYKYQAPKKPKLKQSARQLKRAQLQRTAPLVKVDPPKS